MRDENPSVLREFLAERDTPCPACGYNLRGVQDPVCPECGGAVELTVAGPARARGYLLLLLVAFAWLALVSGMNSTRDARVVLGQSMVAQTLNLSLNGGSRFTFGGNTVSATSIIINGNTVRAGRPFSLGGSTITPIASGGTRNWAQVRWQAWTALGWSVALGLAALSGLLVVLIRCRELSREGPGRVLVGAAIAMVGLHLSVQAFLFVRELVG